MEIVYQTQCPMSTKEILQKYFKGEHSTSLRAARRCQSCSFTGWVVYDASRISYTHPPIFLSVIWRICPVKICADLKIEENPCIVEYGACYTT